MSAKSIFKSKTFWFNVLAGVLGVIFSAGTNAGLDAEWWVALQSVANIGLRFVTSSAVTVTFGK